MTLGRAKNSSDLKPGWLRTPTNGQAIVFIHGFTASAASTWGSQDCTWPQILNSDSRFDGAGVFLAEYESKLDSGPYGFEHATRQVMTQLEVASSSGPKVTDCETILFVGHSAGGIISRNVLVHNLWAFRGKRIGLALVGSPSKGSPWADAVQALRKGVRFIPVVGELFSSIGGKQLGQLTTRSLFLHALDAKFQFVIDNDLMTIVGVELVEHKGKVAGTPPIVSKDSAAVYYKAESVMIALSNHSSICRPDSVDAQAHKELVTLWQRLLNAPKKVDELVRQTVTKLRDEADLKLFTELEGILGEVPSRWQEWFPGIPYVDDWIDQMWRFQHRAFEADCFFHDPELQAAHARHYQCNMEFMDALCKENVSLNDGQSQINKYGKGIYYTTNSGKDLYDEALERVKVAHDQWIEAYRSYVQSSKSRLIW